MGQVEVYQWFLNRRLSGDDRYYSVAEVQKSIASAGMVEGLNNVRINILRLEAYKLLEVKQDGIKFNWRRSWRLSSAYLPSTPKTIKQKAENIQIAKILSIPDAAKNSVHATTRSNA